MQPRGPIPALRGRGGGTSPIAAAHLTDRTEAPRAEPRSARPGTSAHASTGRLSCPPARTGGPVVRGGLPARRGNEGALAPRQAGDPLSTQAGPDQRPEPAERHGPRAASGRLSGVTTRDPRGSPGTTVPGGPRHTGLQGAPDLEGPLPLTWGPILHPGFSAAETALERLRGPTQGAALAGGRGGPQPRLGSGRLCKWLRGSPRAAPSYSRQEV